MRDIVSTYIFPNTLVTLAVNRAQLKRALERSAEYFTLVADEEALAMVNQEKQAGWVNKG